jgi:hypothetical protein
MEYWITVLSTASWILFQGKSTEGNVRGFKMYSIGTTNFNFAPAHLSTIVSKEHNRKTAI